MKRTNLIVKSATLIMSIIVAGNIVTFDMNGNVAAKLTNNSAIIGSVVEAAEAAYLMQSLLDIC